MTRPQEATRKARKQKFNATRERPARIGKKLVFVSRRVTLTVIDLDSNSESATRK